VKIKRARLIYSKLQTENRIFPVLSDSNSFEQRNARIHGKLAQCHGDRGAGNGNSSRPYPALLISPALAAVSGPSAHRIAMLRGIGMCRMVLRVTSVVPKNSK